ncbi:methyltransferase family protein [Roseicella aerolata]|uniref:Isoprenylcysteine carboxylmethyltransferase family protein n=1 Tax=Roseicella aerolata TaxID=2883479 RepID=A0A9X1I9F8_9PROT|nr:isoprenylcysteine carboxylmethyltransferase family protein [Roseicella aerolata]MCB4820141.1 isoprenylcysteine carboxylmethyltransferase family protein [Roseicella aerolata]
MLLRLILQTASMLALQGMALLAGAGTARWPAGIAFLAILGTGSLAMGLWLLRRDPALLRERMTLPIHADQPGHDKLLLLALGLLWFAWLHAMGADAAARGFAGLPFALHALGALLLLAGHALIAWTFAANSFASPALRLQRDRGHRVIDTGPYAYVRHPMYAGALPLFLGIPLFLGSPLGLLAVPVFVGLLALRTRWEEQALRQGLPGYAAYAQRVRHRFVPGLW